MLQIGIQTKKFSTLNFASLLQKFQKCLYVYPEYLNFKRTYNVLCFIQADI